jgi:hypothetical protein
MAQRIPSFITAAAAGSFASAPRLSRHTALQKAWQRRNSQTVARRTFTNHSENSGETGRGRYDVTGTTVVLTLIVRRNCTCFSFGFEVCQYHLHSTIHTADRDFCSWYMADQEAAMEA